jgi:hypothetical protein
MQLKQTELDKTELECHRINNEETDCGVDKIILEEWNNIPENVSSVKKLTISLLIF